MKNPDVGPATLSRRAFLGSAVGLGALCVLKGEAPLPHFPHILNSEYSSFFPTVTLEENDCSSSPDERAPLPARIVEAIQPTLDEVNPLLQPENRIERLEMYKLDLTQQEGRNKWYSNAHPVRRGILYGLYPGVAYSVLGLQRTAFHEGMHLFGVQETPAGSMHTEDVATAHDYMTRRAQELGAGPDPQTEIAPYDGRPGRIVRLDEAGLFPLFDESSYEGSTAGHPYTGENELYAGCLTVIRYFPRSLARAVETLRPADRQVMAKFIGTTWRQAHTMAADQDLFRQVFDPRFAAYGLGRH